MAVVKQELLPLDKEVVVYMGREITTSLPLLHSLKRDLLQV
jgi:hypothetical protein